MDSIVQALMLGYSKGNMIISQGESRIESILAYRNEGSFYSLEHIAASFNVSTRTIQSKLKYENTSYTKILDEVKMSLSIMALREKKNK